MRLFKLASRARKPREEKVVSSGIAPNKRRQDLHDFRKTRAKIVWRNAGNVIEIRARAEASLHQTDRLELTISRNELFCMIATYLEALGDEAFLKLVRNYSERLNQEKQERP